MNYSKDMKVNLKDRTGKMTTGSILQKADFDASPYWWCELFEDGHREVTIYKESDLDVWNSTSFHVCTCGGASVNATRHPQHCDVNKL